MTSKADALATPTRRFETLIFLVLSVLIWPFVSIGIVGSYGLAVWMYQLLTVSGTH